MIEGRKVKIRPLKEKDLESFFILIEDCFVISDFFHKSLSSEVHFKKTFFENGFWTDDFGIVVIFDLQDKIMGIISYKKANFFDSIELSYIIFKEKDRAKGFMKESLFLFSNYLFACKKINRLQLSIPDYHRASIAIAQKCGFAFEGIAREAIFSKGKYLDLCIYSLLRSETKNIDNLY